MGTTLTIIVIVGYAVVQIVSAIVSAQARKKDEQKAREALQRRRQMSSSQSTSVSLPGETSGSRGGLFSAEPVISQPTQTESRRSVADDLAARRKAQLEQLRAQREGRKGSTSRPVQDIGGTPMGSNPSASDRIDSFEAIRRRQADQEQRAREEVIRRKAEDERAGRQAAARSRRDEVQAALQRQRRDAAAAQSLSPGAGTAPQSAKTPAVKSQQSRTGSHLAKRLGNTASLREIFALKEVLDSPVSLRPPGSI